jgi:hypothetical protein
MGRTALCHATLGKHSGETEAMLESDHILLRGDFRAKLLLPTLRAVRADGGALQADTELGALVLMLGEREAALWQKKILSPPSLAQKLGIAAQTRIHVVDAHPRLMATLAPIAANIGAIETAEIVFVSIDTSDMLRALPALTARMPRDAQLWAIRPKGKAAAFKESELMAALRDLGFRPNKTAAWSAECAADRYRRTAV